MVSVIPNGATCMVRIASRQAVVVALRSSKLFLLVSMLALRPVLLAYVAYPFGLPRPHCQGRALSPIAAGLAPVPLVRRGLRAEPRDLSVAVYR
jgi:hypothetical protein